MVGIYNYENMQFFFYNAYKEADVENSIYCNYTSSTTQINNLTLNFSYTETCSGKVLKYTDPSGYKVKWWQWALGAALLDPISALTTAGFAASTLAGMLGGVAGITYTTTTINSILMFNDNDWKDVSTKIKNSWKINNGLFVTDNNKNFWGRTWELTSRFSWEAPQTMGGYYFTQVRNAIGDVNRVDYFGGATYATKENAGYRDGVALGNFLNINISDKITGSFKDRVLSDPLFMHEFGHTFDSKIFGPIYLFAIGMPSLISANNSTTIEGTPFQTHDRYWTERRANRHAKKYFGKHYDVDWNGYSPYYTGWKDIYDTVGNFLYRYYYTIEDYYPTY